MLLNVTLKRFFSAFFLYRTLMIWYDPVVLSGIQRNSQSQSLSHMLNKVFFFSFAVISPLMGLMLEHTQPILLSWGVFCQDVLGSGV